MGKPTECPKCHAGSHCFREIRELGSSIIVYACAMCGKHVHDIVLSQPVPERLKRQLDDRDEEEEEPDLDERGLPIKVLFCRSCGCTFEGWKRKYCDDCKDTRNRLSNKLASQRHAMRERSHE